MPPARWPQVQVDLGHQGLQQGRIAPDQLPRGVRDLAGELQPGVRPSHALAERLGHVVHRVHAQELIRSAQLGGRILNAALELEHQDLVSVELLQQRLELTAVEAAS